jgi:cold shock CspA family protein/ribosome-associated translation inhibitor RaiA
MILPMQIEFRNLTTSPTIELWIRKSAAKLETFFQGIMSCRVLVEIPHLHHRRGSPYLIRIDLTVPGREIVVKHQPRLHNSLRATEEVVKQLEVQTPHKNLRLAISDAFRKAGRQLQDYVRRTRGQVKLHEPSPRAAVSRLFLEEGYGFLATPDGREIYFHKDSVLRGAFQRLKVGRLVTFMEEKGDRGPQASTVRVVGKPRPGNVGKAASGHGFAETKESSNVNFHPHQNSLG